VNLSHETSWQKFSTDESEPWNWTFDFPNGTGYYEFCANGWFDDEPEAYPNILPELRVRKSASLENTAPVFSDENPINGSMGKPLSLTWSITIEDPDGDAFNWAIECNNSQSNSASSASNGTKTLALTRLQYATVYTIWVNATDPLGSGDYTRELYTFTTRQQQNIPPNTPIKPSGPCIGKISGEYQYTSRTSDSNCEQVFYQWYWGDENYSEWLGPYDSDENITTTHKWLNHGTYEIRVKIKDTLGVESNWSEPLSITIVRLTPMIFLGVLSNFTQTEDLLIIEPRLLLILPSVNRIYTSGTIVLAKDFIGFRGVIFIVGKGNVAIIP
jgi:hypothetical protein